MELHVNEWGNGLGVCFTQAITEMLGVTSGSMVHAEMVEGKLVISADPWDRAKTLAKQCNLEALMAKMPKDYDPVTDEELKEWRNAPPVGREIIEDDWS